MTAPVSSATATSSAQKSNRSRTFTPARLAASVAALVLLSLGATWYFTNRSNSKYAEQPLADNTPPAAPDASQATVPVTAGGQGSVAAKRISQTPAPKGNSGAPPLVITEAATKKDAPKATIPKDEKPATKNGANIAGGRTSGTKYTVDGVANDAPGNAGANQSSLSEAVASGSPKNEESTAPATVSRNKSLLLPAAAATPNDKAAQKDNLETGDELLKQNKYGSALTQYKKELNSTDKGRRQKATVKAAQCYANTGNKTKAKQMLQTLIDEGGPEKHAAKKLLNDLEKDSKK